jgi:hypothetical protein
MLQYNAVSAVAVGVPVDRGYNTVQLSSLRTVCTWLTGRVGLQTVRTKLTETRATSLNVLGFPTVRTSTGRPIDLPVAGQNFLQAPEMMSAHMRVTFLVLILHMIISCR